MDEVYNYSQRRNFVKIPKTPNWDWAPADFYLTTEAKIGNNDAMGLWSARVGDEYVWRFNIAMNNAECM